MLKRISYLITLMLTCFVIGTTWAVPEQEGEQQPSFSSVQEMVNFYEDPEHCSIEAIEFAIKEALLHNELIAVVELKLIKTRTYFNRKEYENALKTGYATLNFVEQFGEENFEKVIPRVHFRIAQALIEIGAYKEAIVHRKLQQEKLRNIQAFDRANALDHYIGNLFWNLHEIDSARFISNAITKVLRKTWMRARLLSVEIT